MKNYLQNSLLIFALFLLFHTHTYAQAPQINLLDLARVGAVVVTANPNNIPTNTPISVTFDQATLSNVSGLPFTNADIATAFLLKENAVSIPFTATIIGNIVTIIPSTELKSATPHTIQLLANTCTNATSQVNLTTQNILFTTATSATITAPTLDLCRNATPKILPNIVIAEGSTASFGAGLAQTLEINAPIGFNFVAGLGSVVVSGADISNATLTVTATNISLTYDVSNLYADINTITLQNIQVVYVSGTTTQLLKRTAGTAIQAGNRILDDLTHATLTSTPIPTAPTIANMTFGSGFVLATTTPITVPVGSVGNFYDATTALIYTSGVSSGSILLSPTNLGYVSNTTLATTTFYMSVTTSGCESATTLFTVTVQNSVNLLQAVLSNGGTITLAIPTNPPFTNIATNTAIYLKFSEYVVNSPSGTTILNGTNVTSAFTIVAPVMIPALVFTATIDANATGQWITITANQPLAANSTYQFTLNKDLFQNASLVKNLDQTVSFQTATPVAITAPTLTLCRNNAPQILGDIVINEGSSASFGQGNNQTFEMNAPTGFNFVAGTGTILATGLDISNANLFVSATKITLLYDIGSGFLGLDNITLRNIQVVHTSGTTSQNLLRTGGTAIQADNKAVQNKIHAIFSSTPVPVASASIITANNACSGFVPTTQVFGNVTLSAGEILSFYDAVTNTVIGTQNTTGTLTTNLLGYTTANNTVIGTKPFYMILTSASGCDSPKTFFNFTINDNPVVNVTGASSVCVLNQTTFSVSGTIVPPYLLEISFNSGAFSPASAYGTTSVSGNITYFTIFSSLVAGNYQLRATATLGTSCTNNNTASFIINNKPLVSFIWSNPLSYLSNSSAIDLTDGSVFGGAVNGVVNTSGTYSGNYVVGTQFFPANATLNTHVITYSYTDLATGCTASVSITLTVTAPIVSVVNNLSPSYCLSGVASPILIPDASITTGATALPPSTVFNPPTPGGKFFWFTDVNVIGFPFNAGIKWSGTNYTFDPALLIPLISSGNTFINIPIRMTTQVGFSTNNFIVNVTIYRNPVLDMNLINNDLFCRSSSANFLIEPTLFSLIDPAITVKYKLQSQPVSSYVTLPSKTITPSSLASGDYDLQIAYSLPNAPFCYNALVRQFRIRNNPTPTMSVKNSIGANLTNGGTVCAGSTIIKLITPTAYLGGNYVIIKTSAPTVPITINASALSIDFAFPPIADVYSIVFTYTDNYTSPSKSCSTSTVPFIVNVVTDPLPSFTFAAGATGLSICENINSFTLFPIAFVIPGVGYYNIKKQFSGLPGVNIYSNNINIATDFSALSGTGPGDYLITYYFTYTAANGSCSGVSQPLILRINPLPILTFSFSATEICNYPVKSVINLTPIWINNGGNGIVPSKSVFTVYNNAGVLVETLAAGVNVINPNNAVVYTSSVINPLVINVFQVEYAYEDANGCTNVSPRQNFQINPLPAFTFSFIGASDFCVGDVVSTANFNITPLVTTGGFMPLSGRIRITNVASPSTVPPTPSSAPLNVQLPAGATSFSPFVTIGNAAGEYIVQYEYTDTKFCNIVVVCATRLRMRSKPNISFKFTTLPSPVALLVNNYDVCANVTAITLVPALANVSTYGIEPALVPANGNYTFTKGAFTYVHNGANPFNPNAQLFLAVGGGVGTYTVVYTYTSNQGCTTQTTDIQQFTVNGIPPVSFTFGAGATVDPITGNARVCSDFGSITINTMPTTPLGGTFIFEILDGVNPITPLTGSSTIVPATLFINATLVAPKVFTFQLRYIDVNGCVGLSTSRTLTVLPLPAPTFSIGSQICINIPVSFDATAAVANATANGEVIASFVWNFNDATPTVTTTTPFVTHTFNLIGAFPVTLTVTTTLGCSKIVTNNITIGAIPVASFTTANFCVGGTTNFTSTSTLAGAGNITNYTWDFGDGSAIVSSATSTATHQYVTHGRYLARLTVITNTLCSNTTVKEVFIFPRITPTAALPYKENFDNPNDSTWMATGAIKANLNPLIDTIGFSWKRGVPTGSKINATKTTGGAWSTGKNNNSFYPNERSYVESPCFNFTDPTLNKPMIAMKIWYDTDRGADAGVLYASINDGIAWTLVGSINEGIEWYNTSGIISQPGGQNVPQAWTGNNSTDYKIAKFNLDVFRGQASVRFRMAFGSNADNPIGTIFDGFAFDEVFIGNRNKISLLEHFTNASSSEANTENTFINNFPVVTLQNEIYNIQYHTNFPGTDPMNADNTADPSARALYYGVSQVPRAAIDGIIENRKFSEWGTPVYNRRTLEISPFELSVDFTSTSQLLRFKANVKALEPFTRRVILQTAVIEQEILGSVFTSGNFGGLTFKNVVKKMLPNAAGTLIAQTWLQNTQFQTGEITWSPSKIYNGNRLVLVVFVQDEITKEVYQAGFFNITTNISSQDPTTALDPQTQTNILENEFVVYPNPAQNEVFTGFRQETAEDFSVILFDSYGKRVDVFSLTKGNKGLLINTEKYASGMYFVEITGKNNIKARKKLVIAR